MSEYGSADAMVRLIGDRYSPEGIFTQHILDQPFSVVLLDEIEKAHPLVLNLLLQLFDEGRLTDAGGNTADFRHTVIVMTSNLGAKQRPRWVLRYPSGVLFDIARSVKDFFPPELSTASIGSFLSPALEGDRPQDRGKGASRAWCPDAVSPIAASSSTRTRASSNASSAKPSIRKTARGP